MTMDGFFSQADWQGGEEQKTPRTGVNAKSKIQEHGTRGAAGHLHTESGKKIEHYEQGGEKISCFGGK